MTDQLQEEPKTGATPARPSVDQQRKARRSQKAAKRTSDSAPATKPDAEKAAPEKPRKAPASDPADLSPAQQRRRSRYTRPRSFISRWGVALGLVIGLAGGLFYAWSINPQQEFDTAPWQLREEDRQQYLVAVMLSHPYRNDLAETLQRLIELRFPNDDPLQLVADVACDLARTGYVNSSSGLRAIRQMMMFYQTQGKSGCADSLIPMGDEDAPDVVQVVLATPTLPPPASKTPTLPAPATPIPAETTAVVIPTPIVTTSTFTIVDGPRSFCSSEAQGVIEVRVQDFEGEGLPGQPVRVRWDGGESLFFTGLKPERGPSYADFEMEEGRSYIVDMPGLADPSRTPMLAEACFTETGEQSITSYRVVFRSN
ncbi:MAG: hypothetical protein SF029_26135 [bacterium]|nr:hypothetical protein [bacterium]